MKYIIDKQTYDDMKMKVCWFWANHNATEMGTCKGCFYRKSCAMRAGRDDFFCADWRKK